MFDQFTDLVADSSGWAYLVIFLFAFIDAVIPVVPSETVVITAGVVAVNGNLFLPAVIVTAAAGALAGDNLAYGIGRRYDAEITRRFFSGPKARRRIDWAEKSLRKRGGQLITVARFIPGGRTAVTLTAGITHYAWMRFVAYDALAAAIWAGYAAFLGYFGGQAFETQTWKGLLLALVIALLVALGIEVGRRVVRRAKKRAERKPTRFPPIEGTRRGSDDFGGR